MTYSWVKARRVLRATQLLPPSQYTTMLLSDKHGLRPSSRGIFKRRCNTREVRLSSFHSIIVMFILSVTTRFRLSGTALTIAGRRLMSAPT